MRYSSLKDIDEVGVSHNPEIKKKVFISKGQIPHLTQLARVTFKSGQIATSHIHQDMYEIFNVESGTGVITVDNNKYDLTPGVCITVDPGEKHEVVNNGKDDLILTVTRDRSLGKVYPFRCFPYLHYPLSYLLLSYLLHLMSVLEGRLQPEQEKKVY